MFERAHHRRIATVLSSLDVEVFAAAHCFFGGGTAIALKFGEYRESVDVDFVVADVAGYRALRQRLTSAPGINAITLPHRPLVAAREVRADQYGLRTLVRVDDVEIKFEIVLEARVPLETPGETDTICGVPTLTALDMATTKLLANADRWADDSVNSRDLVDLAMMHLDRKVLRRAVDKAAIAYGASVERDLLAAIDALQRRPGRLEACMRALQMIETTTTPTTSPAQLWAKIRRLRSR